jgi:hypothetical protein
VVLLLNTLRSFSDADRDEYLPVLAVETPRANAGFDLFIPEPVGPVDLSILG